ncbi:MAG: hypothetical protein LBB14_00560 [Puniceicoccales bacterium]|nr:hypothetical protein [Puniceicoccales bacterium]
MGSSLEKINGQLNEAKQRLKNRSLDENERRLVEKEIKDLEGKKEQLTVKLSQHSQHIKISRDLSGKGDARSFVLDLLRLQDVTDMDPEMQRRARSEYREADVPQLKSEAALAIREKVGEILSALPFDVGELESVHSGENFGIFFRPVGKEPEKINPDSEIIAGNIISLGEAL